MLWHLWRGIGKQPMQITMMMTAMLIVMQTLDKESEVKVETEGIFVRMVLTALMALLTTMASAENDALSNARKNQDASRY